MKKLFILIGSLLLIYIGVRIFKGEVNSPPSESKIISTAEEYVEQKLKTPSTAEFSSASVIETTDPNVYEVRGFVDAQNLFGAMIRNNYYVKLHYSPYNKTYSLLDIKLE